MSVYSDRFIPIRTFDTNKWDISELTQTENQELSLYHTKLRKAFFGRDITQDPVLNIRKKAFTTASTSSLLFAAPEKHLRQPRLSQNPQIKKRLDTSGNNDNCSFRIGVDNDHHLFFLTHDATYIKNFSEESPIETIEGLFQSFAAIPNHSACALSTTDGQVILFNTNASTPRVVHEGTAQLSCMTAQSPNLLFIGSTEGALTLIDFRQSTPATSIEIGNNAVTGISLNNATMLALGSEDDKVLLTDIRKLSKFLNLPFNSITHGRTVAFSPINPKLLAAAEKNTVKIWDVTNFSLEALDINLKTSQVWDPPETDIPFKEPAMQKEITTFCWDLDRKSFKLTQSMKSEPRSATSDQMQSQLVCFTHSHRQNSWLPTDTLHFNDEVYFHAVYDKEHTFYLSREIVFFIQYSPN